MLTPIGVDDPGFPGCWRRLVAEPASFLSLGLATGRWLRDSAPVLAAAAEGAELDGPCPTHVDVRSDNICFRDGRALLVDWNQTVLAHRDVDIACWLPSLHAEGGPAPEEILPDAGPLAAVISGYFADRAGKPVIPTAPRVRVVQKAAAPHRAAVGGPVARAAAARRTGGAVRARCFHVAGALRGTVRW